MRYNLHEKFLLNNYTKLTRDHFLIVMQVYLKSLMEIIYSYNKETGKVMCCANGTFGRAALTLPLIKIEHPLNANGVKWFVYFFLNGQVCPKLKKFVPSLLSTPDSVNKMWAK